MKLQIILLTFCALAFTACNEISVTDGQVPQEYVAYVKPYLGTYRGEVDGKSTEIIISMYNNVPTITVRNTYGNDITGASCGSRVGLLKSIKAEDRGDKNYVLERANFYLEPGQCFIQGRVVTFSFRSSNEFILEILERDERKICPPPRTGPKGASPIDDCDDFSQMTYITGQFKK